MNGFFRLMKADMPLFRLRLEAIVIEGQLPPGPGAEHRLIGP